MLSPGLRRDPSLRDAGKPRERAELHVLEPVRFPPERPVRAQCPKMFREICERAWRMHPAFVLDVLAREGASARARERDAELNSRSRIRC